MDIMHNMYFGEWESPKPSHSRFCQSGEQAKWSYDYDAFGVGKSEINDGPRVLHKLHAFEECEPFRLSIWLSMTLIMLFIGTLDLLVLTRADTC